MNNLRKDYNQKITKWFLFGLALTIPVFAIQAWYFNTEMWVTLGLRSVILSVPVFFAWKKQGEKINSYLTSFAVVSFCAIMIHLGKGMIEMHFSIFASLALLSLFGYMGPVILATLTVALHHLGFWLFIPLSVFNYEAGLGIVLLHAVFVIAETIPTLFIAKKFYNFVEVQGEVLSNLEELATNNSQSSKTLKEISIALSSTSTEQASSVQQTVSAITEIKSMIRSAN